MNRFLAGVKLTNKTQSKNTAKPGFHKISVVTLQAKIKYKSY